MAIYPILSNSRSQQGGAVPRRVVVALSDSEDDDCGDNTTYLESLSREPDTHRDERHALTRTVYRALFLLRTGRSDELWRFADPCRPVNLYARSAAPAAAAAVAPAFESMYASRGPYDTVRGLLSPRTRGLEGFGLDDHLPQLTTRPRSVEPSFRDSRRSASPPNTRAAPARTNRRDGNSRPSRIVVRSPTLTPEPTAPPLPSSLHSIVENIDRHGFGNFADLPGGSVDNNHPEQGRPAFSVLLTNQARHDIAGNFLRSFSLVLASGMFTVSLNSVRMSLGLEAMPVSAHVSEHDVALQRVPREPMGRILDRMQALFGLDKRTRAETDFVRRGRNFVYLLRLGAFRSPRALLMYFKVKDLDTTPSTMLLHKDELVEAIDDKVDGEFGDEEAPLTPIMLAEMANRISHSRHYSAFLNSSPELVEYIDDVLGLLV